MVMIANREITDRDALLMRLSEAESLLKEAARILSFECPKSEYGHLMMAAQESKLQLENYINEVQQY